MSIKRIPTGVDNLDSIVEGVFPSIILVKGKDWRENLGEVFRIGKELATKTGQPNLFIIGVDALTTFYGEKQEELKRLL